MPNMNMGLSPWKFTCGCYTIPPSNFASLHSIGANTWLKDISCFAAKLFRRVGEDCCTSGL